MDYGHARGDILHACGVMDHGHAYGLTAPAAGPLRRQPCRALCRRAQFRSSSSRGSGLDAAAVVVGVEQVRLSSHARGRAGTIPICILLGLRPLPLAPLEDDPTESRR